MADCVCLENRRPERVRGFESLLFRSLFLYSFPIPTYTTLNVSFRILRRKISTISANKRRLFLPSCLCLVPVPKPGRPRPESNQGVLGLKVTRASRPAKKEDHQTVQVWKKRSTNRTMFTAQQDKPGLLRVCTPWLHSGRGRPGQKSGTGQRQGIVSIRPLSPCPTFNYLNDFKRSIVISYFF